MSFISSFIFTVNPLNAISQELVNSEKEEKRRENPKGNKEIWESREMSLVVFMKVVNPRFPFLFS